MNEAPFPLTHTVFGFKWGPALVQRITEFDRGVVFSIETDAGRRLQVFVSAKGRSIQIHEDGTPWKKVKE